MRKESSGSGEGGTIHLRHEAMRVFVSVRHVNLSKKETEASERQPPFSLAFLREFVYIAIAVGAWGFGGGRQRGFYIVEDQTGI